MPEAVLESRVTIQFDWGTVLLSVDEARELKDQLEDALPPHNDEVVYNTGGSFGFGPLADEEKENDSE